MDYHIYYPPKAPTEATQEASHTSEEISVESTGRFYKKKLFLFGIYIFLVAAFFFSLFFFVSFEKSSDKLKSDNKNENEKEKEQINSDFLIQSLLKSKNGKKFILSKLEELIIFYENNVNLNEGSTEKKEVVDLDSGKHIRKRINEDKLNKDAIETSLQVVNRDGSERMLFPIYENGKISDVSFLLQHLDGVVAFDSFVKTYNKQYGSLQEKHMRFTNFMNNYLKITEHNNKKGVYYKKQINKFADMSLEEIQSKMHTLKSLKQPEMNEGNISFLEESTLALIEKYKNKRMTLSNDNQPNVHAADDYKKIDFDWRDYGVGGSIRDQGLCGSCWGFSVAGTVESQYEIKNKKSVLLSVQQLLDCSFKNGGCEGGYLSYTFDYVLHSKGLCTEEQYPYLEMLGPSCKYNTCTELYPIKQVKTISNKHLKDAIRFLGPISVDVVAIGDFMFYESGIFDGDCGGDITGHAVMLVGYGATEVLDETTGINKNVYYYIIKNSWGVKWGESGYMRIITNEAGTYRKCSLANEAYVVLID